MRRSCRHRGWTPIGADDRNCDALENEILMKSFVAGMAGAVLTATVAAASPGPTPQPPTPSIGGPRDIPYPGRMTLAVDASDTDQRIVRVRETLDVQGPGDVVLLYPEWLPGTHAPEGPIDRLAGLRISASGVPLTWTRDVANVFAFHVTVPRGVKAIDLEFQYLSPASERYGPTEITSTIAILEWNELVLYPAGYFTRQIPVEARVTLPTGWTLATALETVTVEGASTRFKATPPWKKTFLPTPRCPLTLAR